MNFYFNCALALLEPHFFFHKLRQPGNEYQFTRRDIVRCMTAKCIARNVGLGFIFELILKCVQRGRIKHKEERTREKEKDKGELR